MPKDVKKSFILILASIVFWFMAYNAATSKFSVYATNVLDTGYSTALLVGQAAAIISYLPIGIIATKMGRKKTILIGIIELFTAFILVVWLYQSMIKPLNALRRATRQLQEGNLDYSLIRNSKTILSDKELAYCENDCLVVYEYIKKELEKKEKGVIICSN